MIKKVKFLKKGKDLLIVQLLVKLLIPKLLHLKFGLKKALLQFVEFNAFTKLAIS
jgi:hypothetical protein